MDKITQAVQEAAKNLPQEEGQVTEPDETARQESSEEGQTAAPSDAIEPEEGEVESSAPPKQSKYVPLSRFNEVYREKKELERLLAGIVMKLQETETAKEKQPEPPPQMPDFDTMTNAEMARWFMGQLQNFSNSVQEAIKASVEPIRMQTQQERIQADIKAAMEKYPDFKDHIPAMIEIAEKHPTLNAEQVYLLATKDVASLKKSIGKEIQEKIAKKKAARTETRSTSDSSVREDKQFKNVRDAAYEVARKLNII